jgi:ABC-type transport system involved in multi-copper enzyme maturation permease subunit
MGIFRHSCGETHLFLSPVFVRELVTSPRRPRHYVARATYVSALLLLMGTAWLVLAGSQTIRNVGDLARFGTILFQILAPLQLALAVFFAALFTASSVAQEKDRRTLILLLVTDLTNFEVVIGKLLASMLSVLVLVLSAFPLFMALLLLGGVEAAQVCAVCIVTVFASLAAGSLGSTIALWREKTFQSLALTVLILVAWIAFWEVVFHAADTATANGTALCWWSVACSPWRAILDVTRPAALLDNAVLGDHIRPGLLFVPVSLFIASLLNAVAVWKVRIWNPSREVQRKQQVHDDADVLESEAADSATPSDKAAAATLGKPSRRVWTYPVLWREVRTWAYGRKTLAIRLGYLALAALALATAVRAAPDGGAGHTVIAVPFFLLSLFLVNAQAVTSISTERDAKTLDMLLVTDLSPKEFVFGKLFGVFYNTKEMVLMPLVYCLALWWQGELLAENAVYLMGGLLVMNLFVAVLGIHCGLVHPNSRVSVATSMGTVFFLFVGIATCMRIMVAFSGSFGYQLAPFLAFMLGGGVALFVSLGARNASTAIFCAAFTCPFLTFWAITSFLQEHTLGPFLVTSVTYIFTTLTMLIPAISEFDVVSGRATED